MKVTATKDENSNVLRKARNLAYACIAVAAIVGYDFGQWRDSIHVANVSINMVDTLFMVLYLGCLIGGIFAVWNALQKLKAAIQSSSDGLAIASTVREKDLKRFRTVRTIAFIAIITGLNAGYALSLWKWHPALRNKVIITFNLPIFIFVFGAVWARFDDLKSTIAHTYEFDPETGRLTDADEDENEDAEELRSGVK